MSRNCTVLFLLSLAQAQVPGVPRTQQAEGVSSWQPTQAASRLWRAECADRWLRVFVAAPVAPTGLSCDGHRPQHSEPPFSEEYRSTSTCLLLHFASHVRIKPCCCGANSSQSLFSLDVFYHF